MNYKEEIDHFVKYKKHRQVNSVLLCKDERLLAECCYNGFDSHSRHGIKSIAKSIMSICTGIALDKGLLKSLDMPICQFIPEFNQGRDPLHQAITVRHLLTMTSGIFWNGGVHYHCPMMRQLRSSHDWISHIADCAVTDLPGTKYNYKEWDVILLAKILDAVCGDLYDFLEENLYKPLGIKSERWYKSPCGVYYSVGDETDASIPGSPESKSNLSARALLQIGLLFLQNGNWQGSQLISERYIKEAIAPLSMNSGYGYLWWRGTDWYGCRGYGGQSITVVPGLKGVIVIQAKPTARNMGYDDIVQYCLNLL